MSELIEIYASTTSVTIRDALLDEVESISVLAEENTREGDKVYNITILRGKKPGMVEEYKPDQRGILITLPIAEEKFDRIKSCLPDWSRHSLQVMVRVNPKDMKMDIGFMVTMFQQPR